MALETIPFETSEHLASPEAQGELINDAFRSGDATYIATALGLIARARGMTQVAKDAGISREALYKALSPQGDPKLSTLLGVIKALDLSLNVERRGTT